MRRVRSSWSSTSKSTGLRRSRAASFSTGRRELNSLGAFPKERALPCPLMEPAQLFPRLPESLEDLLGEARHHLVAGLGELPEERVESRCRDLERGRVGQGSRMGAEGFSFGQGGPSEVPSGQDVGDTDLGRWILGKAVGKLHLALSQQEDVLRGVPLVKDRFIGAEIAHLRQALDPGKKVGRE